MQSAEEFVSMQLHKEFEKRIEDENTRQNHRITNLEKSVEENGKLALSIERLTISVQSMVEEQKKQGERLEALENRDGEMWRKVIGYAITAIVGILVGFAFKQIGM